MKLGPPPSPDSGQRLHWLARPATIRLLWRVGLALLTVLVLADPLVHGHPHFGVDGWFGFNAWFGFFCCVALVILAKGAGILLKRREDFYDE